MINPYLIDEPTLISVSGGRTSGLLLWKVLEANNGFPENSKACFSNTGLELPQTLDFIQDMSDRWGVPITWLEYTGREVKPETIDSKRPLYNYFYKEVDRDTASLNGAPFTQLIKDMGCLPNPMSRSCSGQLKVRTIIRYLEQGLGWERPHQAFIGIRADEPSRARKLHGRYNGGQDTMCPMWVDGITKEMVGDFWRNDSNFDLGLPNDNGVTPLGNCLLCHLKGQGHRQSIIKEMGEASNIDWWIKHEKEYNDQFDRQAPSYEAMKVIATTQGSLFDADAGTTIPCFCGD